MGGRNWQLVSKRKLMALGQQAWLKKKTRNSGPFQSMLDLGQVRKVTRFRR